MKHNETKLIVTKHTTNQTILLHLTPGIIQLLFAILSIPLALKFGFVGIEAQFTGNLVNLFVMMPMQIGFLLYVVKKNTNTYRISKLIPFQEKSKLYEYLIFIVLMVIWSLCVEAVLSPLENGLRDGLFGFIPERFVIRNTDFTGTPKDKLIFTACFAILANGVIAPVTEELYFRGYLLPRINLSPILAVIVNASLFSLYHFFSPWYFFSRLLMMLPIYYWVMKRKNIRFSLIAHLIANIYTGISLLLSIL